MARASMLLGLASWQVRQEAANREAARRSPRMDKPRRKLNQQLRARLITTAAGLMKRSEPSPFAFEAVIRAWLRSHLCLRGWQWADADFAAEGVTEAALAKVGARRPTWKEGQMEFTCEGLSPVERTRCVRCHAPLPEGHRKFCSLLCAQAYLAHIYRISRTKEEIAVQEMQDAAS